MSYFVRFSCCAAAVLLAVAFGPVEVAGAERGYQEPVAGRVVDLFRPPSEPYGPGNRGWEYETQPGAVVVAANEGSVVFAGQVGADLHVTVRHADGVRTSYSFLASIQVRRGEYVKRGEMVATSEGSMHFGVRGDRNAYLDPALLFEGPGGRVRLVPLDSPTAHDRASSTEERPPMRKIVGAALPNGSGPAARPDVDVAMRAAAMLGVIYVGGGLAGASLE